MPTLTLGDHLQSIKNRIDDSIDTTSAIDWLNAGQNIMAIRAGAVFPTFDMKSPDMTSQFVFDDKWAEIPVLYACARFKQMDLMATDSQTYMAQFENLLRDFVERYDVPQQYKDSPYVQQFTATSAQTSFTITKDSYDPQTGNLVVYISGLRIDPTLYDINSDNTFVLKGDYAGVSPLAAGTNVCASWEIHDDLQKPPYSWWGNW